MRNLILAVVLLILFGVSLFSGSYTLDVHTLLEPASLSHKIFFDIRLPRSLLAFFAGGTLALSGLLFQSLFRNALMSPYTLGISSGAMLGAGIAVKLKLDVLIAGIFALSLFGFLGAFASTAILMLFSLSMRAKSAESVLLLGIALSFFYSAVLLFIFYLSSPLEASAILHFTFGSLSTVGYHNTFLVMSFSLALLGLALYFRYDLQLLSTSEESAQLKGLNVVRFLMIMMFSLSLAIGVTVSIVGPIGFIGLIIPHVVKRVFLKKNSLLLVPSFVVGGLFLLACDVLSRLIEQGSELPVGIITASIGAPFFVYLLLFRNNTLK